MTLHEFRFIEMEYTINTGFSEDISFPALLRKAAHHDAEYAELITSKKAAYTEYRKLRDEAQELLIAQQNMETFLKAEREEEQRLQKEKEH